MTLPQLRFLRLEHCDIGGVENSETSTLCVETRQMSVLAIEEMSVVETGVVTKTFPPVAVSAFYDCVAVQQDQTVCC